MVNIIKKIYTNKNNPIELFIAGENAILSNFQPDLSGQKSEKILVIGVFHGDEPEGEDLIYKLIEKIKTKPDLIGNNTVLFLPCLNPDGKNLKTRTNANGVDLNRNFPTNNWELSAEKDSYYSGTMPASEIETKFLIEIINEYMPDKILTLHTPYRVVNYDGPAKELAQKISKLNGYPVEENIGYPTPGSFGTYCGIERNIATITLELPENESIEKLWQENKQAFYCFVKNNF